MENFQTLLILMVVIWLFGAIFRFIKLPVVFGELIGGIIVGPLVLNLVNPDSEAIKLLAELGIFFLMLHAGLETDPKELFRSGKKSFLVAIGSVIIPFVGGYLVAQSFGLPLAASLFIGMNLSITAMAIAARLLKDYGLTRKPVGQVTMGALVIGELLAFVLFSATLSVVESGGINWQDLSITLIKIFAFFGFILYFGYKTSSHLPKVLKDKGFTLTLISALVLGLVAEAIGLHIILGAFLAGLFIREEIIDEKLYSKLEDRIYGLSYSFLGPIFFASLAFHLDFSVLTTNLWFLVAILAIGVFGKIFGATLMARHQKLKWRDALVVGLAMNSRGAIDLVIASIGVEKEIITQEVFSVLVLTAFLATLISIFAIKPIIKNKD